MRDIYQNSYSITMSYQQELQQPYRWNYAEFDEGGFQIRRRTLFVILAAFSVFLLVALLLLYARWVTRSAVPPPPTSAPAVHLPPHAPPPAPRGLDPANISSIPVVLHKSSACTEAECCICLGIFTDGDKVKVLPQCHHCFHSECVDKWLTAHSSCPLCRASLWADSLP